MGPISFFQILNYVQDRELTNEILCLFWVRLKFGKDYWKTPTNKFNLRRQIASCDQARQTKPQMTTDLWQQKTNWETNWNHIKMSWSKNQWRTNLWNIFYHFSNWTKSTGQNENVTNELKHIGVATVKMCRCISFTVTSSVICCAIKRDKIICDMQKLCK